MRLITILCLVFPAVLSAGVPNQLQPNDYQLLWNDSPFTSKPIVENNTTPLKNPLEDYALGGVSKLADGYRVTLLNKKDPSDKVVIRPGSDSDFKVIEVKQPEIGWKDTIVTLESGGQRGTVEFEEKLLTVTAAAPANPNPAQAQRPQIPQIPNNTVDPNARKPRPRVVRPPTPPTGR